MGSPSAEDDALPWFDWATFLRFCGPGFLMCIAFLDPGNLEADLQQGGYTGFSLVWVLLVAHVIGFFLQSVAAKLGNVTGLHLAQLCKSEFPSWSSLLVYVMIEIAIIGVAVQEVLGTAIAMQILLGVPLWAGCLLTGFNTFLLMAIEYFGVRKLELLVMALVAVMGFCFLLNFFLLPPSIGEVLQGFLPSLSNSSFRPAMGTLGAVVMPHNIYLHSALVLSRAMVRTPSSVHEANKYCMLDAAFALCVSLLINLAVMGCFAQHFFSSVCSDAEITSSCIDPALLRAHFGTHGSCRINGQAGICAEIGLRSAGDVLAAWTGKFVRSIWALGLLAAGLSSTMTGTYAGQFVMEGFLDLNVNRWLRVLIMRSVALIPAVVVAVGSATNTPLADTIGQWLNVLQAVQLPFAIIPLLLFTDSARIMGEFQNSRVMSWVCWSSAGLVMAANLATVFAFIPSTLGHTALVPLYVLLAAVLAIVYFGSLVHMVSEQWSKEQAQRLEVSAGVHTSYGATEGTQC